MAELLAAGGIVEQDSVALYLSEMLPQDCIIVADAVVYQRPLDAVVISPQGLTLLKVVDWAAMTRFARRELGEEGAGVRARYLNAGAQQAVQAMKAFLQDEFPYLNPVVRCFHVVRLPNSDSPEWKVLESSGLRQESLAETLMAEEMAPDAVLTDEETRQVLGEALRDRWIARSQRAQKPFIFRSGGLFGRGARAWTIRALVRHMDRHPSDGIHHLSNGTLEKWLEEIGAPHLAELAHTALRESPTDTRQALELFLVGTGLVKRRRPRVRPKRVNLGYIIADDTATAVVRLHRKGGYCFGELRTSHPWMQVEPKSFQGEPCRALVTVNTSSLLIDPEPYHASVIVSSRAMAEPVEIPVRFRVVAMPSPLHRAVLRPAGAFLLLGALGAGIGLLMALAGVWPGWNLPMNAVLGPNLAGAAMVGIFWALLGVIWRALLPPAWPFLYGLRRLLVQVLIWAAVLAVSMLAGWGLASWRLDVSLPSLGSLLLFAVLYGLAPAIVPAVITEEARARRAGGAVVERAGRTRRAALLIAALVLLLIAALFLPQIIERAQQSAQLQKTWAGGQQWAADVWTRLNDIVDELLRQFYLRLYDRRAP